MDTVIRAVALPLTPKKLNTFSVTVNTETSNNVIGTLNFFVISLLFKNARID